MAKLGKLMTNERRKRLFAKYRAKLAAIKAVLADPRAPEEDRAKALVAMAKIPRNAHRERIRNRCALTGRPRAYLRKLGLSRMALRKHGLAGDIPGLIKSSW